MNAGRAPLGLFKLMAIAAASQQLRLTLEQEDETEFVLRVSDYSGYVLEEVSVDPRADVEESCAYLIGKLFRSLKHSQ